MLPPGTFAFHKHMFYPYGNPLLSGPNHYTKQCEHYIFIITNVRKSVYLQTYHNFWAYFNLFYHIHLPYSHETVEENLGFFDPSKKMAALASDWHRNFYSPSLQTLNAIWRNLYRKLVRYVTSHLPCWCFFFRLNRLKRWSPWCLIDRGIFTSSSAIVKRNLTKIDIYVYIAICQPKMTVLASG